MTDYSENGKYVKSVKDSVTLKMIENDIREFLKEKPKAYVPTRGMMRKFFMEKYNVVDPWEHHGYSWTGLMKKMNLKRSAKEMRLLNQSNRHAELKKITKYSEERTTWGSLYLKEKNKNSKLKTVVVASDFHDIESDKFAVRLFLYRIKTMQPDVIVFNGDLFDFPEFGKYHNDPREYNMSERIEWVNNFLAEVRSSCPDSQIDLIEGNHEARMARFLCEQTPMMADILNYVHGIDSVRELFKLDEYEVNYVAKGNLKTFTDYQMSKTVLESEKIYYNLLNVRHERPNVSDMCMFGVSGHHHKLEVSSHKNPMVGNFMWVQNGGMHITRASYANGDLWNIGFSVFMIDTENNEVLWDYVSVGKHRAIMDGVVFTRKKSEYYPFMLEKRGY